MASNPDMSAMAAYLEQNSQLLVSESIMGARTLDYITTQTGVKGPTAINTIMSSVEFQPGACGFTPKGTTKLSQRKIDAKPVKVNDTYCPLNVVGKYGQWELEYGANHESIPFERYITESVARSAAAELEKVIWQGDTSKTGSIKAFDGFVKIALADGTAKKVDIAVATTKFEAVKAVLAAIPDKDIKEDTHIFCSPAFLRAYNQELVEKNLYHFEPGKDFNSIMIPGSIVHLTAVEGLIGVTGAGYENGLLFAARKENMVFGTDVEEDTRDFRFFYNNNDDEYRLIIKFIGGVNYAFSDGVVIGKLKNS